MQKNHRGARFLAIKILSSWEKKRLPIDQLMEEHIARTTLGDPRDRQLIMTLVYGVLRWRGYLDWVVEEFSSHPLSKIKNLTLQALRVGIFQLLFLDRIPVSAAINETVQALKDMKQPKWLTGYVNGMLRTVERERQTIPVPRDETAGKEDASMPDSALLSHPDWLISRWQCRYGPEGAISICRANNSVAPITLRINTKLISRSAMVEKLQNENFQAQEGKFSPLAIRLVDYQGSVAALPGFTEGLFQVQDEAAQLVSLLFGNLQPGKLYLDGCAGLGGKTTHLAQILPEKAGLVANEPHPGRVKNLRENLRRLRLETTVTIVEGALASLLPDRQETFTGVLVDAPCSGLGVIRRHPDIRWNRKPEDLLRYQEDQLALLTAAAQLVEPSGILVYATCSTEPEENDEVIMKFLTLHPGFTVSDCTHVLPEAAASLVDSKGYLRTLPGTDGLDGFFAARLIKMKNEIINN